MKKLMCLLLIPLFIMAFVGCARQQEIEQAAQERLEQRMEDSAEKVSGQSTTETPTPSPTPSTEVESNLDESIDSSLITSLFEGYKQTAIDNNLEYSVVENSLVLKGYHYIFQLENVISSPTEVTFDEGAICSCSLSFLKSANMQAIKDFIAASFMITGNMDLQSASASMREMVNSYNEETYSKVFESGDYTLFLIPSPYFDNMSTFRVVYKEDTLDDIDKSKYTSVDYETAKAPMNANTKIVLDGAVIDTTYETISSGTNCIEFKDGNGNKYYALYYFAYMPVVLENGQTYTFYGYLTSIENDYPVIQLEYLEQSVS